MEIVAASNRGNPTPATRFRRSFCLIASFKNNRLCLQNFVLQTSVFLPAIALQLIEEFETYVTRSEFLEKFSSIPQLESILDILLTEFILLEEGSKEDVFDKEIKESWSWGEDAQYFHYTTRMSSFEPNPETQYERLSAKARAVAPPSAFLKRSSNVTKLALAERPNSQDFWEVLHRRRTYREFNDNLISLEDLSNVLFHTWGKTKISIDPNLGEFVMKTSPSGGSRHPIEVYAIVLRASNISSGIYHYSVKEHALELLRNGDFSQHCAEMLGNQPWVKDAAVVFLMTAVLERSMWKYTESHAYRVLYLDAGHIGQTFHLVCTALNLAPFTSGAINSELIERFLNIDGISEIPLYSAAVGVL